MIVRPARAADRPDWIRFRQALYDDPDAGREIDGLLADPRQHAFIAVDDGRTIGFVEVRLREYAEGCDTGPVGYVEGIRVEADARRRGVASALVRAAEDWARQQGCTEMASDARIDNGESIGFHRALGFDEVERIVCFRKSL